MPNRFVEPRPGETATRYCAADSQEQWKQMADALQAQFDQSRRALEQLVMAHPAACLGAAVLSGIVLGWWIKRR